MSLFWKTTTPATARHVLTSDMYRRFVERLPLPPGPTIVDLGASNGGFPLLLKSMGLMPGRIIAVEMNPATFRRMRFNVESNFDCPLTLLNVAIADRDGTINVALGRGGTGDSIFQSHSDRAGVSVRTLTLDSVIGDLSVDLLKMDIEGAEYLLLKSNGVAALTRTKYVLAEIHPQYGDPDEVVRFMADKGLVPLPGMAQREDVHCFVNQAWGNR